jgi:hypothetical protein
VPGSRGPPPRGPRGPDAKSGRAGPRGREPVAPEPRADRVLGASLVAWLRRGRRRLQPEPGAAGDVLPVVIRTLAVLPCGDDRPCSSALHATRGLGRRQAGLRFLRRRGRVRSSGTPSLPYDLRQIPRCGQRRSVLPGDGTRPAAAPTRGGPARGAIVAGRARRADGSGPARGAPVRALAVIGAVVGGIISGTGSRVVVAGRGPGPRGRRPERPPGTLQDPLIAAVLGLIGFHVS